MEGMRNLLAVFLVLVFCGSVTAAPLQIAKLTVEHIENPLGIDISVPIFGWQLLSNEKGQLQTGYEILVSDNEDDLKNNNGSFWQTGVVLSDSSMNIIYKGKPLTSFTRYYWKVRVYDKNNKVSEWSKTAWFETAMLKQSDWIASWISDGKKLPERDEDFYKKDPMPGFKKIINLKKPVRSARLYITGAGYFEAYLNGQKVGSDMLSPGWTNFDKRILYRTYDITRQLDPGANSVGILLGNGWYNPLPLRFWGRYNLREVLPTGRPSVKAQFNIIYTDGSSGIFSTDSSWAWRPGPIIKNSVYLGEEFDGNFDLSNWFTYKDIDSETRNATVVDGPKGRLEADLQPSVKISRVIKPVAIKEISAEKYVVDMGENFAGIARIKLNAPKGTVVHLRYGEDSYKDGLVNGMTAVAGQIKRKNGGPGAPDIAWQEDVFTASGGGMESWNPRFTFHMFRYVEITGWPGTIGAGDIEGLVMNADVATAGNFESSSTLFSKIQENTLRTFKSNIFSVQSDCAGREKFGYGGDLFCTTESFSYNYNMYNFYRKVLQDFEDDQRPLGGITETAPFVGLHDKGPGDLSGPLGWQLGYPYLVKKMYEFYGDKRIVEKYYPSLTRQINFLIDSAKAHLYFHDISDHESLEEKPEALTASLFYFHHVKMMEEFSLLLDKPAEAENYAALANQISKAIYNKFYKGDGLFDNQTQAAQVFPLWYKIVEAEEKTKTLDGLIQAFAKKNNHVATGIFGTKMFFDVLRENNLGELAYTIAAQEDFPGWGHMVKEGATSLWETWKYSNNTYSQSHPMFGSITEWFYRSLLGINATAPAFKTFQIKPQPVKDLQYARGNYETPFGKIETGWEWQGSKFKLFVRIPVNTKAEVWVPATGGVLLNGKPVKNEAHLKTLKKEGAYNRFMASSGYYEFQAELSR